MVDLSKLMQDAAILEVIDKSADEASNLSAQNSYQAMRIEELQRDLAAAQETLYTAELDANLALERLKEAQEALKNHLHLDNHNAIVRQLQERAQRAEALAERYAKILDECVITLRHARVFICTREKMHPDGQKLYDELLAAIDAARAK